MVFDTLSNSEGCLIRPFDAESNPTYGELVTAFVKLQFSVRRLVTG